MTKISQIILILGDNELIIIDYQKPLNEITCHDESSIIFKKNNAEIILTHDFLYHNLCELAFLLEKALRNQLTMHKSITQDLGFLFNQYSAYICGEKLKEPTHLILISENNNKYWPGNDYNLWAKNFVSWIYNKPDGSIVFEITPFYPFMYCEPKEEPHYIPYKEWIKTYKPYFITTLSKEKASMLLKQTKDIIKIIEQNQNK